LNAAGKKPATILILVFTISLFLFSCSKEDSPTDVIDTKVFIDNIVAVPDTVLPGNSSTLTITPVELDETDTLSYTWTTIEGHFGINTPQLKEVTSSSESIIWTAPGHKGNIWVYVKATNGSSIHNDSINVYVNNPLAVSITSPLSSTLYEPTDSIQFTAEIGGFTSLDIDSSYFRWRIADSTLLETESPERLPFKLAMGYGEREVILDATVFTSSLIDTSMDDTTVIEHLFLDTLYSSDTVMVNNSAADSVGLFEIEKSYKYNRLTWNKYLDRSGEEFAAYVVARQPGLNGEAFLYDTLSITDGHTINDTSGYIDSLITIGQLYQYNVLGMNSFGRSKASNDRNVNAGIFTTLSNTSVGDLIIDSNHYYACVTMPAKDSLLVLDIASNTADFRIKTGDGPFGLAFDGDDELYIANSNDTTITVVNIDNMEVSSNIGVRIDESGEYRSPLYIAYREFPSMALICTVAGNNYPVIIEETFSGTDKYEFDRAGLISDSSFVLVDETRGSLYLSEYGGFPTSLFKYTMVGSSDNWTQMEDYGQLGHRLRDMAFTPDGSHLFLACESPYRVQIVPSTNGFYPETSSLPVGPYPNSVCISTDGLRAFSSNSNREVQIWDISDVGSPTYQKKFSFSDPVIRDGVEISENGDFLIVVTYNAESDFSRINIIQSP